MCFVSPDVHLLPIHLAKVKAADDDGPFTRMAELLILLDDGFHVRILNDEHAHLRIATFCCTAAHGDPCCFMCQVSDCWPMCDGRLIGRHVHNSCMSIGNLLKSVLYLKVTMAMTRRLNIARLTSCNSFNCSGVRTFSSVVCLSSGLGASIETSFSAGASSCMRFQS